MAFAAAACGGANPAPLAAGQAALAVVERVRAALERPPAERAR
jgi:hypothetical protein